MILAGGPVRAVLFDLDGTLVDSFDAIHGSLSVTMEALGMAPLTLATVRRMVGRGVERLLADAVGPERVVEALPIYREHYGANCRERTQVLPGVTETLQALRAAGIGLAVCTNKPAGFSRDILAHLGLARHFTAILGPEDAGGRPKPDPAMLQLALARLGATPDEAIYVGDMPLDAESARAAGLRVVLVPTGACGAEELRAAGGDAVIGRIEELREVLGP